MKVTVLQLSAAANKRLGNLPSLMWPLPKVRPIAAAALMLSTAEPTCASDFDRNIDGSVTVAASPKPRSFAVYVLSRGKGVPKSARAALARAEGVLDDLRERGGDITFTKERIGLEGETRLCATFADQGLLEEALERIRGLTSGVDLVNLIVEPCDAVK